ncbi:MAG: DUF2279 domain-containing protein, partial [Bacteroidota bacterium]
MLLILSVHLNAQHSDRLQFFEPADTFHQGRFWTALGVGTGMYTAAVIGLNEIWYQDFPRREFHFFNDWNEWKNMDKYGHLQTAYFYTAWGFKGARWTGMDRNAAMWTAAGISMLFQATIETFDGFSSQWGFSIADIGFNTLGVGTFILQEKLWQDQRISIKFSSSPSRYEPIPISSLDGLVETTLQKRTEDIFGNPFFEAAIKDYNAQTYWASFNIASFLKPNNKFPKWLNIAVGYGVEGVYGGFSNEWTDNDGNAFRLSEPTFKRRSQFYLSPDIDFTRIKTKSYLLKTAFV